MRSYRLQNRFQTMRFVGFLLIVIGLASAAVIVQAADTTVVDEIRDEIIPIEGTETEYDIPLSLYSLPQFVEWWYTLVPLAETDARFFDGLDVLVAPCCDDNQASKCCCEGEEGQACNLIRSGKGLAAHLIYDLDYDTEQVTANILQWFQFARPDYFIAAELRDRQMNPQYYGFTTQGSCYRGLCNTPISEGGCGGMNELIEPTIESSES